MVTENLEVTERSAELHARNQLKLFQASKIVHVLKMVREPG
jgi:hypothetical protein